jgi:hypothetical protein
MPFVVADSAERFEIIKRMGAAGGAANSMMRFQITVAASAVTTRPVIAHESRHSILNQLIGKAIRGITRGRTATLSLLSRSKLFAAVGARCHSLDFPGQADLLTVTVYHVRQAR